LKDPISFKALKGYISKMGERITLFSKYRQRPRVLKPRKSAAEIEVRTPPGEERQTLRVLMEDLGEK